MSEVRSDTEEPRRIYEPPKIVHTEPMQGRAISCAKENDANCGSGPLFS